jgi:hypothetical protein
MDLEEQGSVEPVVERTCEECGAKLTEGEIRAAMESGRRYLCSVHAAEDVTIEEAPESEPEL